jgi:hypothetical protein
MGGLGLWHNGDGKAHPWGHCSALQQPPPEINKKQALFKNPPCSYSYPTGMCFTWWRYQRTLQGH